MTAVRARAARARQPATCAMVLAALLGTSPPGVAEEPGPGTSTAGLSGAAELASAPSSERARGDVESFIRRALLLGPDVEVTVGETRSRVDQNGARTLALADLVLELDGLVLRIARLVVSLEPARDGVTGFSIELPDGRIELIDRGRGTPATLVLPGAKVTGAWSNALQMPVGATLDVAGAALELERAGDRIDIEALGLRHDASPSGDGAWDSELRVTLSGLGVEDRGRRVLTAGHLEIGVGAQALRLAVLAGMKHAVWLQMLADALSPWEALLDDQLAVRLARVLAPHLVGDVPLATSWRADLALRDVAVHEHPPAVLDALDISLEMRDDEAQRSRVALDLRLDALEIVEDGKRHPEAMLAPRRAEVAITLDRLPARRLVQAMAMGWSTGIMNLETAGKLAGLKLASLLFAEQTALRIERLDLATPDLDLAASGAIQLDPVAAVMASGSLEVELKGLESLLELAGQGRLSPDEAEMLVRLHAIADSRLAEDGRSAHRYDLELTPLGALLLNGRDAHLIIGQLLRDEPPLLFGPPVPRLSPDLVVPIVPEQLEVPSRAAPPVVPTPAPSAPEP